MARKKTPSEVERAKGALALRLREIRADLYGEKGATEMALALGVPVRSWYNYERGVTVPADVLLRFIDHTGVEPTWLLHGRGERYRGRPAAADDRPTGARDPADALMDHLVRSLEGGQLELQLAWWIIPRRGRD